MNAISTPINTHVTAERSNAPTLETDHRNNEFPPPPIASSAGPSSTPTPTIPVDPNSATALSARQTALENLVRESFEKLYRKLDEQTPRDKDAEDMSGDTRLNPRHQTAEEPTIARTLVGQIKGKGL